MTSFVEGKDQYPAGDGTERLVNRIRQAATQRIVGPELRFYIFLFVADVMAVVVAVWLSPFGLIMNLVFAFILGSQTGSRDFTFCGTSLIGVVWLPRAYGRWLLRIGYDCNSKLYRDDQDG